MVMKMLTQIDEQDTEDLLKTKLYSRNSRNGCIFKIYS
jgi:hypothetical protein